MEYMIGFGSLYAEFWLGNELLHKITNSKSYILRVELWEWDGHRSYAEYSSFKVDSMREKYKLTVGGYSGTGGKSLSV